MGKKKNSNKPVKLKLKKATIADLGEKLEQVGGASDGPCNSVRDAFTCMLCPRH
jgi:hypothetical protein